MNGPYPTPAERLVLRIRLWWRRLTEPFPLPDVYERHVHDPRRVL